MGKMEKKMETTTLYDVFWCYLGIMEKKMETITLHEGYVGVIRG